MISGRSSDVGPQGARGEEGAREGKRGGEFEVESGEAQAWPGEEADPP